jgi:hypothetical protein
MPDLRKGRGTAQPGCQDRARHYCRPSGTMGPRSHRPAARLASTAERLFRPQTQEGRYFTTSLPATFAFALFAFLRRRRLGSQHLCDIHARLAAGNAFNRMAHKSFSLKNVIKKVIFLATRSQRFAEEQSLSCKRMFTPASEVTRQQMLA